MSSASKIIQAAAGNIETGVEPVGTDFDGTNDYLSRSSDLVGNTDSKTFTFSVWIYRAEDSAAVISVDDLYFYVNVANTSVQVLGRNSSNTNVLNALGTGDGVANNTWAHLLVSVDLANASNRYVYLNDELISMNWATYTNANIDFTRSLFYINRFGSTRYNTRLAGLYLDYTYRDLSVEANRRDFIDADGLYVTPPTSGIISVPMDDPADPGRNDGTGGDFTLNGVVAQSGRGPNQYNAAASEFDGSNDYLNRSSALSGASDSKTLTVSFWVKLDVLSGQFFSLRDSSNGFEVVRVQESSGNFLIVGDNSSGTGILVVFSDTNIVAGKWHHLSLSVDMADSNKRHLIIDGVDDTPTWTTYTDDNFAISQGDKQGVGAVDTGSTKINGDLSNFYFDTTYIDLSSNNPFYDSETGKPKDLGASGEIPTGSAPLIYLPLRADDAGNNLGTGGDFTVNSGPYTGARGPSEFWAESVEFDGTGNNHLKQNTATVSDSKEFTVVLAIKPDDSGTHDWFELSGYTGSSRFSVLKVFTTGTSGVVQIESQDSSDFSNRLSAKGSATINTNEWNTILISGSMTNSNTFKVYVNGSDVTDTTSNYDNENLEFSKLATQGDSSGLYIGRQPLGGNPADGGGAIYYIDNVYTDFSQEANRLKFIDAFNNPTDIAAKIDSGEIAQPLIYLPFDDRANLGNNLGTIGDFTEVGTLTDDGYVNG